MIVGIDSMILIYAGRVPSKNGKKSSGIDKLTLRAKLLLHQLRNDTIILPTVAVSELLVPVPVTERGALVTRLAESFICQPFDLQAASYAADLWQRHKTLEPDDQYAERHVLKADTIILGCVLAAGGTVFYTHDRKFRTLANTVMSGRDLPTRGDDLFIEGEIERGEE